MRAREERLVGLDTYASRTSGRQDLTAEDERAFDMPGSSCAVAFTAGEAGPFAERSTIRRSAMSPVSRCTRSGSRLRRRDRWPPRCRSAIRRKWLRRMATSLPTRCATWQSSSRSAPSGASGSSVGRDSGGGVAL